MLLYEKDLLRSPDIGHGCCFILISSHLSAQNPWNGKVVLQGFWWDYWNNNYNNGWSNYLSDLAPRLRDLGIDAVRVPPPPSKMQELTVMDIRHLISMISATNTRKVPSKQE